jgi:hypothetical protein
MLHLVEKEADIKMLEPLVNRENYSTSNGVVTIKVRSNMALERMREWLNNNELLRNTLKPQFAVDPTGGSEATLRFTDYEKDGMRMFATALANQFQADAIAPIGEALLPEENAVLQKLLNPRNYRRGEKLFPGTLAPLSTKKGVLTEEEAILCKNILRNCGVESRIVMKDTLGFGPINESDINLALANNFLQDAKAVFNAKAAVGEHYSAPAASKAEISVAPVLRMTGEEEVKIIMQNLVPGDSGEVHIKNGKWSVTHRPIQKPRAR